MSLGSDEIDKDTKAKLISGYEEELVLSLQGINLVDKLTRYEIFKTPTRNCDDKIPLWYKRLSSLTHGHVNGTLVTRYVLQQLREPREWELIDWENFLIMLESVGGRAETIAVRLRSQLASENDIVTEANISDIIIQEGHINDIISILAEYADKWKELCIELKLPHNRIEEDCNINGRNSAVKRLIYVLEERIKKSQPLTLRALTDALRSRLVSCAAAADKLEKEFRKTLDESHTNQIPYGRSTLLGAGQYQSSSYEWMKDGKVLYDDNQFDGVNKSVLYIDDVSDSEKYTCHVKTGKTTHIKQICLEIVLPKKNSFLVSLYSQNRPTSIWPPVSSSAFITLALIHQTKVPEESVVCVSSSIDAILEDKVVTEYNSIFNYHKKRTLFFVEGRPGSGKTTLVNKVAYDWASNMALKGASRVYIIPLRMLNFEKVESLKQVFTLIYQYCELDITKELEQIKQNNGESVCFILDGLDEYNDRRQKKSVIWKLIHKQILPESMVIVASRPIGTAELRKTAPVQKRIEVVGFTRENVWRYIENYRFGHEDASSKLKQYLKLHTNVLHMCYLPVHASMVCYLYDYMGEKIPCTETKMYEHFTELTIFRKLKREGAQNIEFDGLASLDKEHRKYFDRICELAFDMSKKSVQFIKKDDTQFYLDHDSAGSDGPSLGLITIDSTAQMYGYKHMYVFLHLTFQEYLAARHLCQLPSMEHITIICSLRESGQKQILKFYCGLLGAKLDYEHFWVISDSFVVSPYLFECAFESQSTTACNHVLNYANRVNMEKASNTLYFANYFFYPSDFIAIAYVLSNSDVQITTLMLCSTNFEEEGIKIFINAVDDDKLLFIKTFEISYEYQKLPISSLNVLLQGLRGLQHLNFSRKTFTIDDLVALTKDVVLKNLQEVHIFLSVTSSKGLELLTFGSSNLVKIYFGCTRTQSRLSRIPNFPRPYGASHSDSEGLSWSHILNVFKKKINVYENSIPGPVCLCNLPLSQINLSEFKYCTSLSFINCGIDDGDVEMLCRCKYTKIVQLCLAVNKISNKGAKLLASFIQENQYIQVFNASFNYIDDSGAETLATSLQTSKYLSRVDLQCNKIEDWGIVALAKKLDLFYFYLWNEAITEERADEFQTYNKNMKIKSVYIRHLDDAIIAYPEIFMKMLTYCSGLKRFNFSDVVNFDFDINALSERLKIFHNIREFILTNRLNSNDIPILSEAIKSWKKLTKLELTFNHVDSQGAKALAKSLSYCQDLEVLNLSSNDIGPEGITAIGRALSGHSKLKELNLCGSNVSCRGGDMLSTTFANTLKILNLCNCSIGVAGVRYLMEKMMYFMNIEELMLVNNEIETEGLINIANNLSCSKLVVLLLSSNNIQSEGMKALRHCLTRCPVLQELYLNDNNIDENGMEDLTEGMKYCKLKVIDLSFNNITSAGVMILSTGLKYFNHLEHLALQCCAIDTYGIAALVDDIRYCDKLRILGLGYNYITNEGAFMLTDILRFNLPIEILSINNNSIEDQALKLVKQKFQQSNIFSI